jgi:hypothetical protein
MANKIPEFLNDMRAYLEGADSFIGVTNIELPELSSMTTEVTGIGLAGKLDAPVRGHFESMEVTFNWRTIEETGLSIIGGEAFALELYGDTQHFDGGVNEYGHEQVRVVIRGRAKSYKPGTMEAGKTADASNTLECHYIKFEVGGKTIVEIDKFGYKAVINGVDIMEAVRRNIGMS